MLDGLFLGTGSIPTKERNSHGVLLTFYERTSVLVDCGEGIQRQMLQVGIDMSKIDAIFITHEHIDHVYGVGGVLMSLLKQYPEKRVSIYGPSTTLQIVENIVDMFMIDNQHRIEYISMDEEKKIKKEFYTCYSFRTYHNDTSLGYCFESENKRIALLGDVGIPDDHAIEKIIDSIQKVDVVVIDGVHITVEEASIIAAESNVKRLYLTPILLNETKEEVYKQAASNFINTYIPDDFDKIKID